MTKWQRGKTQINKIRNEKGDITTNTDKSSKIENTFKSYIQVKWKI
jgi:hypothetical protein